MRWLLVIVAAVCAAVVPSVGTAATSSRCGGAVLKDWSDGKLDRVYPVRCYQDALNRMPEDMRSYTSAPDDIQRALLAQLRQGRTDGAGDRQPGARREALSAGVDEVARSTGIPRPLVALGVIGIALVAAGSGGLVARWLKARADS
ncbi:MAG TPA: hypothetical protein VE596_16145 [Gaiellaceae bacterium]|jgi:hypothetical protein|nr:hypothetical protein [Gaiellaceae bacterium]